MPNLITHYLCGIEAIKNIENDKCRKLIRKHQNVFNLGVQGPDILFYYELWPWSAKTQAKSIGQEMHKSKVNLAFKGFLDYIKKQNNYVKEILAVYFMGFLSHNCMDSIGHPYIFYRSGFKMTSDKDENLYIYYHRKFETNIDVLLCKLLLNKKVHEINHDRLLEISASEENIISEMYESVIKSVFNYIAPKNKIVQAIKDMLSVEKLLKDPYGIKKKAIAGVDYVIYGYPLFSSLVFPHEIKDGLDYLNLKNSEWCMPFDKDRKSTRSFLDLFKKAHERSQKFCDIAFSTIFSDNPSVSCALKLFGNNSYTSGIDCDIPVKFKYRDIIFEKS